jgi:tetratricopeptide (TPR) repeat protein
MNQQQNTFKTMVDNESYLQNGMDISISDTESNVSTQEINATNNDLLRPIPPLTSETDTQDEIEIIIDRTPSPPNENEEYEENSEYDSDATEDDGLDEDYDAVRILLDNMRDNEQDDNHGIVGLVEEHAEDDEDDEDDEGYIGLACIGPIIAGKAMQYYRIGDSEQALKKYLVAISLTPYMNYYNDIGTIYESMGDIEKAKHYYLLGIDYTDCILAMYNIADLFRRDMNNIDKTKAEYSTKMMLKYYEMAANKGDNEALEMVCALAYGKDPVRFSIAFKQIMEHQDDHFPWDGEHGDGYDDDEEEKAIYYHFLKSTNNIEILQMLQKTDTDNMNEAEKKHINDCIGLLNKETSVMTYNNKVSLFKSLNHVVECGICYDEKLNINLHCGHCVCTDCYVRLYTKQCPFCRIDTQFGIFD